MKVIQIDKNQWTAGLAKLAGHYRLYGPVRQEERLEFKRLAEGELPELSAANTHLSPKAVIYPQSELMFSYSLDETKEGHHQMQEVEKDYSPRAIIGIRPCDAAAFLLVKRNFGNPEYPDPFWIKAYESCTLIGHACDYPGSTCFCTSAGSGPYSEVGLDVLLMDNESGYLAKAITDRGAVWLKNAGWSDETDGAEIEQRQKAAESRIVSTVPTEQLKAKNTKALFEAPFWQDVAFACLNCGTCTYSCPTCWCFDIQDEVKGHNGLRMRNWDSCMYPLFTLEGSGHNPRPEKYQRVRQRFMHKLKYYVDKYQDGIQCVGCGRCVRLCPVNIDIRSVCEKMNSYPSA
jgi:sulfhydrogenase subunit beta (sulfur reductase)